jgi:hypothetical protein
VSVGTDRLLPLVFDVFRDAWATARKDGEGEYGPPSAEIIISQHEDCDCKEPPFCRGGVLRRWAYAGEDFEQREDTNTEVDTGAVHSALFFHRAVGAFFIAHDGRTVIVEFTFGPRYGRGRIYDVQEHAGPARLTVRQGAPVWFS